MKNKKIKKIDPYKHWLKNPIKLDDDEISENIIVDSSGFSVRDYRFQPKIIPDDISNYQVDDKINISPNDIELFYAWNLRNRRKAINRLKKYRSRRKESNRRGEDKRFQKTYIDCKINKQYYLYDDIIRNDCIHIIQKLLKFKKDYERHLMKLNLMLMKINFDPDDYPESIYKDFIETLLDIIRYIFTIKLDDIYLMPGADKYLNNKRITIKLNKLIIMSDTMRVSNL